MVQPLYCSVAHAGVWGERQAMVTAPLSLHDSLVSRCFHGCWVFHHRHFPPRSASSHPLDPSLCSQQQPSPGIAPQSLNFSSSHCAVRVCMAAAWTIWFSFHLGCHRSAVSLSALNVSPLIQTMAPTWGSDPCFSSLTHQGQVQSTNIPVFLLSFFILPSFAWVCIFFSAGQVLLSALSWCSSCISVSEGMFLMYLWKEMYSTFTYSSAILFSVQDLVLKQNLEGI